MKFTLSLILFLVLLPILSPSVSAEDTSATAPGVAELRAQLSDVQAKEAELQARARQLDEDLTPENIERSLAGVGSTRPEELREMRRRQLSIERDSVRSQLNLLAASRQRLESAIRRAEGVAYQQSAEGFAANAMAGPANENSRYALPLLAGAMLAIILAALLIRRTINRNG